MVAVLDDQTLMQMLCYQFKDRHREIVELVSDGLTNPEVGKRLFIAPSVVADYLSEVFATLSTYEGLQHTKPNRYIVVRLFSGFFERHPYMRPSKNVRRR